MSDRTILSVIGSILVALGTNLWVGAVVFIILLDLEDDE